MVIGKIYCIKNKVNGKCYVGKTLSSIEKRFHEHCCERHRSTERPLYRAMNKYGIENFEVNLLEECDYRTLSEREAYWISQLDTYNNGYNATLGGDGKVLYNYEQIVEKYKTGMLIKELADYFECSVDTIRTALHAADIDLSDIKPQRKKIACNYNDTQYSFRSCTEAAKWILEQRLTSATSVEGVAASIGKAANGKLKTYLKCKWWWE